MRGTGSSRLISRVTRPNANHVAMQRDHESVSWVWRRLVAVAGILLPLLFSLSLTIEPVRAAGPFTVTTTEDLHQAIAGSTDPTTANGLVSLRSAIEAANNAGGATTINLPPATYRLTLGELTIGKVQNTDITIVGQGATPADTVIDAASGLASNCRSNGTCVRAFNVDPELWGNISFTIQNLTVTGGVGDAFGGGAILAGGAETPHQVKIINCFIYGNSTTAGFNGGAISFAGLGSLTVTDSIIANNTANEGVGGGIWFSKGVSSGDLTIERSVLSGNVATGGPGAGQGGALWLSGSAGNSFHISKSSIVSNVAQDPESQGGAIYLASGTLDVAFSRIVGNLAVNGSAIFGRSGSTINANDNWWGRNSGPGSGVETDGSITLTRWLQLRLTASPSQIRPGGTATLTADILGRNTDGPAPAGSLNGLPPFPSIPASIFTNPQLGTISNQDKQYIDGQATDTFTAGAIQGTGSVTAAADGQTVTITITITAPDLTVTKTHTGDFRRGQTGAQYTITVTNSGGVPTTGTVTVTDTLPAGLTATSMSGDGWTCDTSSLTCTRSDELNAGASYPAITLTVNVATNAPASVTNSVTVSGGGESNTSNNTASDTTTIILGPDLTVTKSHSGSFFQGQTGAQYSIIVNNDGDEPTNAPVAVSDTLPTGLTLTGFEGQGWTCNFATVTCSRSDTLAPGASYPALTLTVDVATNAPASVTNTAIVSGGGQINTSNDVALDQTSILVPPAFTSADGTTFTVGVHGTFTVTTTGVPTPTITLSGMLPEDVSFADNGDGTGTLSGTPAAGDGGVYNLVFTAQNGVGTDATQNFTLTVNEAPVITTQPSDQVVCAGDQVTFTASADGYPVPDIQWQVSTDNGATWSNLNGETGTTLSFVADSSQDGYQYRAVFSNSEDSVTSSAATLTVDVAPVVTTQPSPQSVSDGDTVSFTATASGKPIPTIQWQVSTDGGDTWTDLIGETGTTLSFTAELSQNGYQYRAVFTNHCGTATTNAATLTVTFNLSPDSLPDGAVGVPYSQTITATSGTPPFQFEVTAGALPPGLSLSAAGVLSGTPSQVGTFSFTVTATDANGRMGSHAYDLRIDYAFQGFFPPVANPPSVNRVDPGSLVNIRFSLGGNQGLDVLGAGMPASRPVNCTTLQPTGDLVPTRSLVPGGLYYNPITREYVYSWLTERSWSGTCREFVLTLEDGTTHVAYFRFEPLHSRGSRPRWP